MIVHQAIPSGWGWTSPPPVKPVSPRPAKPDASRDDLIVTEHLRGRSMRDIGVEFGVTGARIHQIIARARDRERGAS